MHGPCLFVISIYIYIYVYIYICIYVHTFVQIHIVTYIYIYIYTYTHVCMTSYETLVLSVCTYTCTYVCMYIYIYIYINVQLLICFDMIKAPVEHTQPYLWCISPFGLCCASKATPVSLAFCASAYTKPNRGHEAFRRGLHAYAGV